MTDQRRNHDDADAFTDSDSEERRQHAYEHGYDDHLHKRDSHGE